MSIFTISVNTLASTVFPASFQANDDVVVNNGAIFTIDTDIELNSLWVGYNTPAGSANINGGTVRNLAAFDATIDVVGSVSGASPHAGKVSVITGVTDGIIESAFGGSGSLTIRKKAASVGLLLYDDVTPNAFSGFQGPKLLLLDPNVIKLINVTFGNIELNLVEAITPVYGFTTLDIAIKGGKKSFIKSDGIRSRELEIRGVVESFTSEIFTIGQIEQGFDFQVDNPLENFKLISPRFQLYGKIRGLDAPDVGGRSYTEYTITFVESI